jgi:hypothetical protein
MSYRYISANDVVDIVDIETQNKINEMDCVYIDGIKPHNQHFNLADHDKQIRDDVIEDIIREMDILNHQGGGLDDLLFYLNNMKGEQNE